MAEKDMSDLTCPQCGGALARAADICHVCLLEESLRTQNTEESKGAPPLSPEEIAEYFPQFEILECLGRGGMGVVYRARQKSLNRTVAIKVLAPERDADERFAERFAKEAELLGQMNHPGIVTVYDFGKTRGLYFLVMEFVDGVNLRDILQEGKLEPERALAIVPRICEALQFAHERGIAHRDIKPENILLDRAGVVKIADFGVAAIIGEDEGEKTGTPSYMPPGEAGETDHRADIYALGVVFYEMLTGERPEKDLVRPSQKAAVDAALDEIVLRALARNPGKRFQTIAEMSRELQTLSEGKPKKVPSKNTVALTTIAACAMIGLSAWLWSSSASENSNQEEEMKLKDISKKVGAAVVAVGMANSAVAEEKIERASEKERAELKKAASERGREDRNEYSRQELGELEELYQVANKNWKTDRPKAKKAMEELVKKYKKANRTGCAMLYLGQLSHGDERDKYLETAIKDFSDCYYYNGVQVGGWARFLRMLDLQQDGKKKEAEKLEKEIRTKYKKAINHSGYRLVDILDQMEKEK